MRRLYRGFGYAGVVVRSWSYRKRGSKFPLVKILGGGVLEKKLSVERCFVSASAKEKIEKAGGAVKE